MAHSLKELRGLSDERLIEEHDDCAQNTVMGLNYYLEEIERRDQNRQTKTIIRYTFIMLLLTGVITVLTVINVIAIICPEVFR